MLSFGWQWYFNEMFNLFEGVSMDDNLKKIFDRIAENLNSMDESLLDVLDGISYLKKRIIELQSEDLPVQILNSYQLHSFDEDRRIWSELKKSDKKSDFEKMVTLEIFYYLNNNEPDLKKVLEFIGSVKATLISNFCESMPNINLDALIDYDESLSPHVWASVREFLESLMFIEDAVVKTEKADVINFYDYKKSLNNSNEPKNY